MQHCPLQHCQPESLRNKRALCMSACTAALVGSALAGLCDTCAASSAGRDCAALSAACVGCVPHAHGSSAEEESSARAQSAVHSHARAAQVCYDACGVLVPRGKRIAVRSCLRARPPSRAFTMPALTASSLILRQSLCTGSLASCSLAHWPAGMSKLAASATDACSLFRLEIDMRDRPHAAPRHRMDVLVRVVPDCPPSLR